MRIFWSVLGAIALSAPEVSVANWNEGIVYAPDGLVDQFERGSVWQRELLQPERAPIVGDPTRQHGGASPNPAARRSRRAGASDRHGGLASPCDSRRRGRAHILRNPPCFTH